MPIQLDQQLTLKNSRRLGYAEIGDPGGQPVLQFHGLPSSRMELSRWEADEIAVHLNARVFSIDRPGVGLSDFWPYQIAGWPEIVTEFADQLNLPRFSVLGFSSGAKYAAACAWKIPHHLAKALIVSGNAPVQVPEVFRAMSKQDRLLYFLARRANGILGLLVGKIAVDARKDPTSALSLLAELSEPDRNALKEIATQKLMQGMVAGAFQSGTRGVTWDWRLEALPWGFSPAEIEMPVSIWHGEADTLVPMAHARYLARVIPHSQAHFIPGEGHISLATKYYGQLLQDALGG